jgi:hypothetical protein
LSTNAPPFQFSTLAAPPPSQTTMTNTLPPVTTTPTKSFFSNAPKFSMADITTKPPSLPMTTTITTNIPNEKPSNSGKIFLFFLNIYIFL